MKERLLENFERKRELSIPREPKSLLQANITIDHRSQITERERKREKEVSTAERGETYMGTKKR